jgi:translation initiation factor 2B subunit (eIF-2B alpha/beta/delta family)
MPLPTSIQHILADNISGSVTLLKRLMTALETELLTNEKMDPSAFINIIHTVRRRMELFTVIRHFCDELILSHNVSIRDYPENYLDFIAQYKEFWEKAPQRMMNHLLQEVSLKDRTVMFHSNSGTIREVFSLLAKKDLNIRVLQTLSAPAEEGRVQAHDLAEHGYPVTLITDAMAGSMMEQADYLILAADQLRKNSIINKTGSLQMVLAAQQFNVPVIVITESRKAAYSKDESEFKDAPRDPNEVLNEIVHPNIKAENYYFEEVPRYLVNHLITEKGPMHPGE